MKLPFLTCFVLQFEEALNQGDPLEGLRKLVDPRLGENYPIDSVLKVEAFLLQIIECYISLVQSVFKPI